MDSAQTLTALLADPRSALWQAVAVSLTVSIAGLLIAVPVGVVSGYGLARLRFTGRDAVIVVLQSLLSFPTVVVGLLLYMLLSHQGPLGFLGWLFDMPAMIAGDALIAWPVIAALSLSAIQSLDPAYAETAEMLGASRLSAMITVLFECRFGVAAACVAAFGRVISEVGCALMVGGNIEGYTRTMTTAIALETSKGEFDLAVGLGALLLLCAFVVTLTLGLLQGRAGSLR